MIDNKAMFKLTYGLFVLTTNDGVKDNGCIVNTVSMLTSTPTRITVFVNKQNYTEEVIRKTGVFNVSVLTQNAPFALFQKFGFSSGRDKNKFAGTDYHKSANGLRYIEGYSNAVISAKVIDALDYGTHTLFVAEVTEAVVLNNDPSVTYEYYFAHIKPKTQPKPAAPEEPKKKRWVCKICGWIYEGETLPPDLICPICKHPVDDFEPID